MQRTARTLRRALHGQAGRPGEVEAPLPADGLPFHEACKGRTMRHDDGLPNRGAADGSIRVSEPPRPLNRRMRTVTPAEDEIDRAFDGLAALMGEPRPTV